MKISSLEMTDFRNYQQTRIIFGKQKNYLIGNNAQGKTNLLEAIYLSCLSKSFRTAHEKEAISFSKHQFILNAEFEYDNGVNQKVSLSCSHSLGKEILINRKRIDKISEFIGNFPVVLSSPEEYDLTNGAPLERRKFIDILLSQINRKYIHDLIEYQRILKQKNTILLNWKLSKRQNQIELESWNERLVVIGSKIIDFRRIFSEQLSKLIENIYCKLVVNNEKLQLTYQPNIKLAKNNKTADLFWRALKKVSDKEIQRGISLVGPHRDDFCFKINEKEIKKFGSRGQHKTVIFSLAAAEYSLIKKLTSETPIILIDDLYSEIDKNRENKILELLDELGQIFITSTAKHENYFKSKEDKYFVIENGALHEITARSNE